MHEFVGEYKNYIIYILYVKWMDNIIASCHQRGLWFSGETVSLLVRGFLFKLSYRENHVGNDTSKMGLAEHDLNLFEILIWAPVSPLIRSFEFEPSYQKNMLEATPPKWT